MDSCLTNWKEKIAVVTGAGSGIGAAIVKKLIQHNITVIGLSRNLTKMYEIQNEMDADSRKLFEVIGVNIASPESLRSAFQDIKKKHSKIHLLVNCAAIFNRGTIISGTMEAWKTAFEVNVVGMCAVTQEALKLMCSDENDVDVKQIININCQDGHRVNNIPWTGIYPATKHAVTAVTESLRMELFHSKKKIKVSSISPGYVKTNLIDRAILLKSSDEFQELNNTEFLKSDDVAEAVIFIISTPPHVEVYDMHIKPFGHVLY